MPPLAIINSDSSLNGNSQSLTEWNISEYDSAGIWLLPFAVADGRGSGSSKLSCRLMTRHCRRQGEKALARLAAGPGLDSPDQMFTRVYRGH